jgi:hypothetical protein
VNAFAQLQEWYQAQCNGDWEHTYGVSIGTLDNPGWTLEIDLTDTAMEGQRFEAVSHGVAAESLEESQDWFVCEVRGKKFVAAGGPRKLDEMVLAFVNWAGGRPPNTSLERTRER